MRMLDALVHHEAERAVCTKTFRESDAFVEGGVVSALVAIELFAQAAAAHFGYAGMEKGAAMGAGALLGSRKIELFVPAFTVGERLEIEVRQTMAMPPMAQFDCTLTGADGRRLAEGTINVAVGI
jgi:predicted hotdog family 3-hydroxylacyl-ACP dehydratase